MPSTVWAYIVKPDEAANMTLPADAVLAQLPGADISLGPGMTVQYQGATWYIFSPTFPTRAEVLAWKPRPGNGPGVPSLPGVSTAVGVGKGVINAAKDAYSGINAVGHFFSDLTNPQFWVRAGKILIGGVILLIGLVKLTGHEPTGVVKKAVKVAPFL